MTALAAYAPKWEVAWAPAKPGVDKRMWVRFPEITATYGDQDAARNKIVSWMNEKGMTVCSSYFTIKTGLAINLACPQHVEEIVQKATHVIPGIKGPLKAVRLRQIEVENAFEMVITGVPTEYEDMDLLITKWLREKFQNDGQHTIAATRVPPNEPETFVFNMISWSETSKVLSSAAQEAFKTDFAKYGQTLSPPQMLHQLNTNGIFKTGPTRIEKAIEGGVGIIDQNFKDLRRLIDENQQKNEQQHMATQLQIASVTTTLGNAVQAINNLEDRVMTTQRALLTQSKEIGLSRNLADNTGTLLNLELHLLIESDPAKKVQLQLLKDQLVERKRTIQTSLATNGREFLSIVNGPIDELQQSPATPSAPPGIPRPTAVDQLQQSPATPSAPPGIPRPTINLRRSSATITDAADESGSAKKRRVEEMPEEGEITQSVNDESMTVDKNLGPNESSP
ncbi:hypothetical protein GALMADRAFT_245786 [Galerina marginata CBS 339.88]|uniref:Uncharacterized protein n=1 Tax=Galerina marginata (strain CBS 339.88) TaxID=685588 RepID=A0A067T5M4_GALM3|nr:hypothetical protein GALMADRAFT_245786 [Galerina marginata CBS 339.88]